MLQVVWVYIWMISKHLMLLFNVPDFKSFIWMFPFQNISCYCLTNTLLRSIFIANISKHLMLLFNTAGELEAVSDAIFQNISCYCLTPLLETQEKMLHSFQNISCYCLTPLPDRSHSSLTYFKTSHVIV